MRVLSPWIVSHFVLSFGERLVPAVLSVINKWLVPVLVFNLENGTALPSVFLVQIKSALPGLASQRFHDFSRGGTQSHPLVPFLLAYQAQPILEQQVIKSQGEVDDMYEPITPDDLVRKEWTEKAKCPDQVMATLLPYQAEG